MNLIDEVIEREGGWVYTNTPGDRGKGTFAGVTLRTYNGWRARQGYTQLSPAQFEAVSRDAARDENHPLREEMRQIYRQIYLEPWEWLPRPVRCVVVDAGVNHGQSAATRMLQRAAGVADDGIVGPKTRAAVRDLTAQAMDRLVRAFTCQRCLFYAEIVRDDPTQSKFILGWLSRAFAVEGGE